MIPLQEINDFLAIYGWLIALFFALVLVLAIIVILLINRKKKEPKNDSLISSLGGEENIDDLELKGSRLTVKLKNKDLLKKDDLHLLGVKSIIEMNDKIILVVEARTKKQLESSIKKKKASI